MTQQPVGVSKEQGPCSRRGRNWSFANSLLETTPFFARQTERSKATFAAIVNLCT